MTEAIWKDVAADSFPWVDTAAMIEIDRVTIEDLQIGLKQMMENAGRNLAQLILGMHTPRCSVVLAGRGGKGGGGPVCARHLANHGVAVTVVVTHPAAAFRGVPAVQLGILQPMGIEVIDQAPSRIEDADVIVDAVIGYSLGGAPRGSAPTMIEAANHADRPVVSLDVPSGVDSTAGDTPGVAVRADQTLILAAPKIGLRSSSMRGRLFVGDISVPPSVFEALGLQPSTAFGDSWLVEITG